MSGLRLTLSTAALSFNPTQLRTLLPHTGASAADCAVLPSMGFCGSEESVDGNYSTDETHEHPAPRGWIPLVPISQFLISFTHKLGATTGREK